MNDLIISGDIRIPYREINLSAIRSQGPGGQHVNKTATGIHLRFDIYNSSLPETVQQQLLGSTDRHISKSGVISIKSQQSRSQEQNRLDALARLQEIIANTLRTKKPRKATRPGKAVGEKRLTEKKQRGRVKELRQKVPTRRFE